ncbi:SOS response-associated peptidase [Euryhalocaulis caribicus]|uniref:SOS response-associated peptidase n=1 Tax=Euryhalocaulis caribicus TaxID=1161401 RepID=UPI0003A38323|nr:SOS response-associated peptidase [Euryhalocaulis caribicus]
MCGRFAVGKITWEDYQRWLKLISGAKAPSNLEPRFNIAPTDTAPVALRTRHGHEMREMRFGLVPSWWKKPLKEMRFSTINARAETVQESKLYQKAFRSQRALIPAIGFYEWTGPKGKKQPWFITTKPIARMLKGEGPPAEPPFLCFAGLWDEAVIDGEPVLTFSILTGEPNDKVAKLHDRMPIILPTGAWDAWLDPATADPRELMTVYPADDMAYWKVPSTVSNPRSEGEILIVASD